jgi:hypothetical protein
MEEPKMKYSHALKALALFCLLISFSLSLYAAPKEQKEWTLLVYLNGNNSLDEFGPKNINEMEKVGSTDKVNVVVQWASLSAGDTKRLLIKQDNDINTVTSPVVQDLGKVDMGDYNSLIDFVKWGVQNYPAKHYFIDVWDHGGGWHLSTHSRSQKVLKPMDISWDDNSSHFFTIPQLGLALKEAAKIIGHKVDIYASDACLMAMPEVSTEMADSVQVYGGSEETEPADGWPYDEFLKAWNQASDMSADNVAKLLSDLYVKAYQGGEFTTSEVTFSTFDLSKTEDFNRAIINLGASLGALTGDAKAKAVAAISKTQTFTYGDFGDLGDFLNNLVSAKIEGVKSNTLDLMKEALTSFVTSHHESPGFAKATGVSIWLPDSNDTINTYWDKYTAMQFQQTTHWGDALKSIYKTP